MRKAERQPRAVKPDVRAVDLAVQRAIALMRNELTQRWTVSQLARRVALSRPVFARRFVEQTGTSPLRFLTRCRMERAADLLATSQDGLAQIAGRVGYASEFAFNRAFKRHHGIAPGSFRREVGGGLRALGSRPSTPRSCMAA